MQSHATAKGVKVQRIQIQMHLHMLILYKLTTKWRPHTHTHTLAKTGCIFIAEMNKEQLESFAHLHKSSGAIAKQLRR